MTITTTFGIQDLIALIGALLAILGFGATLFGAGLKLFVFNPLMMVKNEMGHMTDELKEFGLTVSKVQSDLLVQTVKNVEFERRLTQLESKECPNG